ncbi:MAG: TIGR02452 family protein [Deltaproteobacteria bacterium]|nr:TIGR02452 family protein [Deltaproteobacteria bacterium]
MKIEPSEWNDDRKATDRSALEILQTLDRGTYVSAAGKTVAIGDAQRASEQGTQLFTPEALARLVAASVGRPDLEDVRTGAERAERARASLSAPGVPGVRTATTTPGMSGMSGMSGQSRASGTGALNRGTTIEVVDATTQQAAATLATADGGLVLLNFASAVNPGGGFLGGSKAQEEDLCRSSGLYRTLLRQPEYYRFHRAHRSPLYSDHLIFSPNVPFFKIDGSGAWLDAPFLASVITAPAPNLGAIEREAPADRALIEATFERRWTNVFAVAEATSHRILLLGAWGCGVFRNEPELVAQTAKRALFSARFSECFERVVFAIPTGSRRSLANLSAFRRVLGG